MLISAKTEVVMNLSRRSLLKASAASVSLFAVPAFAATPLKIGFAMSLTGPNAGAGKMFLLAREVWRDDINAKGGLLGRPVEFVYYDDQSNPSLVPALYTKLIDVDHVDLVVSPFGTNQIAPAMPVVIDKRMVFTSLLGTGVNDTFKYDRYFQILPNGPQGNRSLSLGFFETALTLNPAPKTVALLGEDSEFGQNVLDGARANIEKLGLRIVSERRFPANTVDFTPVVRATQAAEPDIVFVASYPGSSVGIVRAVRELNYAPRMFGGAMIGLTFTALKAQLGDLLNGIVINENYVPEPTMKFAGVDDVLQRYQEKAKGAGVDPLGFWSPMAFAELQVLGQAVNAVGKIDQKLIADYIHRTTFETVIGPVKFGPLGEWDKSRILFIQYQHVHNGDADQFRRPGVQVILYPAELKSGNFIQPFAAART
jgi:branched-chain amino acid transport system substrate-binding protein